MKVSYYYNTRLVLQRETSIVPRIGDRMVIEVDNEHRIRTVSAIEWRPQVDTVVVICDVTQG